MAGKAERQRQEQQMWARRVAMLLSLAVLAERAAGAPHPVRWLVLWILRIAETAMQDFIADLLQVPQPPRSWGVGRADAIRLALSFRALAAVLEDIARDSELLCDEASFAAWTYRLDALMQDMDRQLRQALAIAAPILAAIAPIGPTTAGRRVRPPPWRLDGQYIAV